MRIGFTAKGADWESKVDARFGRADYLLVYDESEDTFQVLDNTSMKEQEHGVGPGTASRLFNMKADVLITGNGPGDNAAGILRKAKVEIYTGAGDMSIKEAYDQYKNKSLNKF